MRPRGPGQALQRPRDRLGLEGGPDRRRLAAVTDAGRAGGQRSDVVKIFHVDPAAGTICVLSIPRDTIVTLLANQSEFGNYNRINVNYQSGPSLLVQTIEANFGIPINHVVQVASAASRAPSTRSAGSTWTFPTPRSTDYSSLDIPHTGCQLLNGFEALAAREEPPLLLLPDGQWNYDGTSDFGGSTGRTSSSAP